MHGGSALKFRAAEHGAAIAFRATPNTGDPLSRSARPRYRVPSGPERATPAELVGCRPGTPAATGPGGQPLIVRIVDPILDTPTPSRQGVMRCGGKQMQLRPLRFAHVRASRVYL